MPTSPPDRHDDIARALLDILEGPGALTLTDALAALADRGLPVNPDDAEFADALDFGEGAEELIELDDQVAHIGTLLGGRIFTHRLCDDEAENDAVDLFPDGVAMLFTLPHTVPVRVGGDAEVTCEVTSGTDDDVTVMLPPASLVTHGIGTGDLVGLTFTSGVLRVDRLDSPEVPVDPTVVATLSGLYEITEGAQTLTEFVLRAILTEPGMFTTAQAPLTDLLGAAGVDATWELFGDGGAALALGEAALRQVAADNYVQHYDLSHAEARLLADFTIAVEVADMYRARRTALPTGGQAGKEDEAGQPDSPERADAPHRGGKPRRPDGITPELAVGVLDALADPWFAYVLAEEIYGPAGAATALRQTYASPTFDGFCEGIPVAGPRPGRAGLLYLRGRRLEIAGSPMAAAAAYREAVNLAGIVYPLLRLALIEFDRGNFDAARSLLDQAGTPDGDLLRDQIDHAVSQAIPGRPGAAPVMAPDRKPGRNEPCWCGSGRKFKVCHGRSGARAPLANRAVSLYDRLCWFVLSNAGDDVRELLTLGLDAGGGAASPEATLSAAVDALLLEGGLMAEFLAKRGELLPEDEAQMVRQWAAGARSVYEVEGVTPDESVLDLRDLRTDERLSIVSRLGSQELTPGSLVCTRVADMAGVPQAFGGFQSVGPDQREAMLELLATSPEPVLLMSRFAAWLGVTIVPREVGPEST